MRTSAALFGCLSIICFLSDTAAAWTPLSTTTRQRQPSKIASRLNHRGPLSIARESANTRLALVLLRASDDDNDTGRSSKNQAEEAKAMLERAKKAREEAKRMEENLVNSKLETLQGLLERQSQLSKADEQDLQNRIDQLKNYRQQPQPVAQDTLEAAEEDNIKDAMNAENENVDKEGEKELAEDYVSELAPEDREALEQVQSIFLEFKEILNSTIPLEPGSSKADKDAEDLWGDIFELESELDSSLAGNITQDDLEAIKAVQGFFTGLAKWTGLDNSDWAKVKDKISESMIEAKTALDNDPEYFDRLDLMKKVFPESALEPSGSEILLDEGSAATASMRLQESDMVTFLEQVLDPIQNDVFTLQRNTNATKVGAVYLLEGTPKLENGDDIVRKIDEQLVRTGLQDKYQVYYLQDVTGALEIENGAEIMAVEEIEEILPELTRLVQLSERPALLVTSANANLSPDLGPLVRTGINLATIFLIATFAAGCYDQENVLGLTSPILFGILGIQLAHELGHFIAAAIHKIQIAVPFTMYPSIATGLMTSNTEMKSPPRNANALFDFALSGPLWGMIASWTTLLYGLQLTASVKTNQVAFLPHMPLEFFQLSTLTSATIESFLGTDVLLSIDPISDNVAVHPLVIAGHVGILINALNLLPTAGTTDGGRMLTATTKGLNSFFLPSIFISPFIFIQGFRAWNYSSYLLVYAFLIPLIQHRTDVPCRNDVDPAGGIRAAFFAITTLLALVAISPSF